MEKPIVGITCGDLNGIGLELIIEILSEPAMLNHCIPVIFCSSKVINYYKKSLEAHSFNYTNIKNFNQLNPKQINIFNCWEEEVPLNPGTLTDEGGKYAVRSLEVATQCLKDGDIDVMVTAPIHKANTQTPHFDFVGHTPYLQSFFQTKDILMILYEYDFRVTLMSEHVPLQEVPKLITGQRVMEKLELIETTLRRDFDIGHPKIAVLGLNPHAGDQGVIGNEETEILLPVINQFNERSTARAFGPYSADGFFARGYHQKFDMVLAMYHDQGLVPFKSMSRGYGVNYTAGLPVIRTSPDHGVAYDLVGKKLADPTSFRNAIFEAIDLHRNRIAFDQREAVKMVKEH